MKNIIKSPSKLNPKKNIKGLKDDLESVFKEWVGNIPRNWEIKKLKFLGFYYGGLSGKIASDFNFDDNKLNKVYIPFTNILYNFYISVDQFDNVIIKHNENQNKVFKNDILFLMSSEDFEAIGKSSIIINEVKELYLNSFCKGFRVTVKNIFPKYLNYQLLGNVHRNLIQREARGYTRINLRISKLISIPILIPSIEEQNRIVNFLDNKIKMIDTLLGILNKKIELLKEQRMSLICQYVIRGGGK